VAAFKDTVPSKASAARAGPIDADESALVDALRPIARLLGRVAAKESVSGAHDEAAPHQLRTDDSDCGTAEACRHDAPHDYSEDH
jgi:hypothetical protein